MEKSLKDVWKDGVSLEGLFRGNLAHGGPEIPFQDSEYPSTAYYYSMDLRTEWETGHHLRDKLCSSAWMALGYRAPRIASSALEVVPADICAEAKFYTEGSTIVGDGLEYVGVRIIHQSLIAEARGEIRRRPGRPDCRAQIDEAYEFLNRIGAIDFQAPINRLYKPIRELVASKLGVEIGELKGAGKETIRRTVTEDFHHQKSSLKTIN